MKIINNQSGVIHMVFQMITCLSLLFGFMVLIQGTKSVNAQPLNDPTIAIWIFDEQEGLYPSKVLHDVGPNEYILTLGRSGYIVPGKFGNALQVKEPLHIDYPTETLPEKIGLETYPIPEGRTIEPMNWQNALFSALMTSGESQVRTQVNFPQATGTDLNLDDSDWTVEFWLKLQSSIPDEGVIFEIGTGPRGENNKITSLSVNPSNAQFIFRNQPGDVNLVIPTDASALDHRSSEWAHMSFVYDSNAGQIRHFVNGRIQTLPGTANFKKLEVGEEDYFTLGRNAIWEQPINGLLDEIRFSHGQLYTSNFTPPEDLANLYLNPAPFTLNKTGPPLLFTPERLNEPVVELGNRKHLFIDDALLETQRNVTFNVNPPKVAEQVMHRERGIWFRKHLDIVEDEDGRIRIYQALVNDYLGVWVSDDGINFEGIDTGIKVEDDNNIVILDIDGDGSILIDENAPAEERWKYITGYFRRGTYVFTSPDGIHFTKKKMALLPFRTATQNDVYWDDQLQQYTGYWRSGFPRTPANQTQREFVMSVSKTLEPPMAFTPVTAEYTHEVAKTKRLSPAIPWFLDNGPLTPGKFGIEFPTVFAPDPNLDGASGGIYNPKAEKYSWAPDTYLAFPVFYFHYYEEPAGRLYHVDTRGGGPTETQFAVSRDGVNWTRYPRPTYVGLDKFGDMDVIQNYIGKGMIRRGDEIWQYVFVDADNHSSVPKRTFERAIYRLVQRYDGFVSIDSPYGEYGTVITRPIKLEGSSLVLNINTDAHGYAIVSLLDENDQPIPGFSAEEAVYINGNHIEIEAKWLDKGTDLSELIGQTVKVRFDMRGSKLYSMQFVE